MLTVLLVTQIIITLAMIGIIMIQRSSSDGLSGIGGGSGAAGGGGVMSSRATATALSRATAVLATIFMVNALAMATITARSNHSEPSVLEAIDNMDNSTNPASTSPQVPLAPIGEDAPTETPSVPVAE